MFFPRGRIEQISSITGFELNSYQQAQVSQLENDIEDLREEIECKNKLILVLSEQKETAESEDEAQVELYNSKVASMKGKIEEAKSKSEILHTYVNCLYSDDFMLNKLKKDVDQFNTEFWSTLKPMMDGYHLAMEDLKKLKEAHQRSLELQSIAANSMAPAH